MPGGLSVRSHRGRWVTRAEKALKWARRHKAQTAALTALAAVLLLATGLTWNVRASRHRRERLAVVPVKAHRFRSQRVQGRRPDGRVSIGADVVCPCGLDSNQDDIGQRSLCSRFIRLVTLKNRKVQKIFNLNRGIIKCRKLTK